MTEAVKNQVMSASTSEAEAVLLRAQIKARPALRLELVDAMQAILRGYGLRISDQLKQQMTVAAAPELDLGGAHVIGSDR